jgi:DnaD/phage-associated family protein
MSSFYWIKLYHEVLDDPKMALLPDRLWRRTIELFVLAGRHDKNGLIPDTRSIAWELRLSTDDLEMDLKQIEATGIIQRVSNGWLVVNFEKRQEAVSGAKRVQQHRERQKKQQYYGDVTQVKQDVTQNRTDTDTDQIEKQIKTTTNSDYAALTTRYEQNIGALTERIGEMLKDDLGEYGLTLCLDAIDEAVRQNKRAWSYAQGILKNWYRDGRTGGNKKQDKPKQYEQVIINGEIQFREVEATA